MIYTKYDLSPISWFGLHYTDPAQLLTTKDEELLDLHHNLHDLYSST